MNYFYEAQVALYELYKTEVKKQRQTIQRQVLHLRDIRSRQEAGGRVWRWRMRELLESRKKLVAMNILQRLVFDRCIKPSSDELGVRPI